MYHSIDVNPQKGDRLTVTPEAFERQMRFFKEHKYNVISLEDAADIIKNKKKAPPRTVVVTFDDGYKNNYTYAFPVLKKYNFPATIFVVINDMGYLGGIGLSWDEILAMQASNLITIGSHTFTHPLLTEVTSSSERLKNEIEGSKIALEAKLGRKVNSFCYPAGRFNEKIKQVVIEAGYKAAVVTNPGNKIFDDDVFAIKRLRISQNCDNLFIFWVETSGYYNFMRELNHK
jgi:peptidoglycan/xylan/chitin deacetylase (PgdA/CDA1 family)